MRRHRRKQAVVGRARVHVRRGAAEESVVQILSRRDELATHPLLRGDAFGDGIVTSYASLQPSTLTQSPSMASGEEAGSAAWSTVEKRRLSGYTSGRCWASSARPPCWVKTFRGVASSVARIEHG